MGTMRILDETGDTCVAWTVDDPSSIANARRVFRHHQRRACRTHATPASRGAGPTHHRLRPDRRGDHLDPSRHGRVAVPTTTLDLPRGELPRYEVVEALGDGRAIVIEVEGPTRARCSSSATPTHARGGADAAAAPPHRHGAPHVRAHRAPGAAAELHHACAGARRGRHQGRGAVRVAPRPGTARASGSAPGAAGWPRRAGRCASACNTTSASAPTTTPATSGRCASCRPAARCPSPTCGATCCSSSRSTLSSSRGGQRRGTRPLPHATASRRRRTRAATMRST